MPLEVILREIRSIFNQTFLFIHFFAGKGIIYHLIAYDQKIEENVRKKYVLVAMATNFLNLRLFSERS